MASFPRLDRAPRIETDRLILRSAQRDDFDAFCATRAKREVMQHISLDPMTRAQLWEKFLRTVAVWPLLGHGIWMVERRSDGRLIGEVGFADFMRDMETPLPAVPEAAWLFDSDVHGQGVAGEALAAAVAWSDKHLQTPLCCIITPDNAPSVRLAQRHGFAITGERVHLGTPVHLLQRDPI